MTDHQPISMYVPARNAERTLTACINAIRSQTRPPDELFIIVDPRSSDRTAQVAAGTGARVITQRGPTLGAARNEAIAAAAHRWLASCDSDVVIERDWLAALAGRRDARFAGIGGGTLERTCNPSDQWRALHMPHHWGEHPLPNPFMLVSEVLFDRRALLAVGGYREDLNYYEDSDLCQRLRDAGYDLLYEPAAKATHLRSDTLAGLLALRWKYSEYRQRHLLERFAGLAQKTAVNREYALNTLSRSLARHQEELAYISFLLFFHHLLMDLRSLLSRRPLIPAAVRADYERQLVECVCPVVAEAHESLARTVRADLTELCDAEWACAIMRNQRAADFSPRGRSFAGAPHDCARSYSIAETPVLDLPPAWSDSLEQSRAACRRFCGEFSGELLAIIAASADYVHGRAAADSVKRLPRVSAPSLRRELESMPIQSFVDEAFVRGLRQQWPDLTGIQIAGPLTADERAALDKTGLCCQHRSPGVVVLAAHLEARPDPPGLFAETDAGATRLVACYQPASRFIPGLDVPSASDLASAGAAAGWTIQRFDTLVGRTRLMLSR